MVNDGAAPEKVRPAPDAAALRRQILLLLPDLRAFARFLARDRTLADDLVQETLVRALGALTQFQAGTNLKAWLFTIQRNAFFEHARRRRREDVAMREHFAGADPRAPRSTASPTSPTCSACCSACRRCCARPWSWWAPRN